MNLRPYFFGMDEVDNKVRNFLVQVFRENNEPYFIEHLFIKYRENKDVEEDQIEALRSFLEKHGKLEKILFLKGGIGFVYTRGRRVLGSKISRSC